uniref:Uncharacterized protein n=1 Tax=Parascaris equorum TaxID=6256 RepID=A0A914R5H2_PAREQ
MEGENFYTFNSASVLNTDGNTLDCDGLSFADNYKHIYSILYNMQKSFQWMTMADDSAVTTLIQSIDVDANNAANVIGNDKTRVNNSHRTNDEDNAELTSMNTTCTGSFDSFGNGSLASRGPLQNNVRLLTSNRSRQLERHPTGIEYEVIRFRRRRVKNESTQTSPDRMRHAVSVEKSIYMSSELDSGWHLTTPE